MDIPYSTERTVEEDVTSFYVEASKDFAILDMPASIVLGARYENTDTTSINYTAEYGSLTLNGDKVNAITTGERLYLTTKGQYDNFLPSIDFDIDVLEDVKVRASYSQTIARQKYADLAGGVVINPLLSVAKKAPNGFTGTGAEGNPNLEPFETDNIDLSAEWYYGDISYLAVGYFSKKAQGYVGQNNTYVPVQGLVHPSFSGEEAIFNVTKPTQSNRDETIDGFEVALQHDFGDYSVPGVDLTGFGIILNATIVDTDAEYNNNVANSAHTGDFALVGISDSYNAALYYDRFGLSARVAYSWRDKFLNFSGVSSGYTDEYDQVDANVSYSVPGTNLTITYDGINLNEEGRHTFERDNPAYTTWRSNGHAKHIVGLRWNY
jgi:TonB-dependent receptor